MAAILGISAFFHDSAAALVVDGEIAAAAQEERFTRRKHDLSPPRHAIDYCLREAGLGPGDLDLAIFYEKPVLKFDRLLETYLAYAPAGFPSFLKALPQWVKEKLFIPRALRKVIGPDYRHAIAFCGHHESHAASAFFPSPFEEAAILTLDGVGEWETATIGRGKGRRIESLQSLHFPHSLGLLYSAFTYFCGFRVDSGEYKLMGLAPYGTPRYADRILAELVDLKDDGSFALNMRYFNYCQGLTMTHRRFETLFDGPPRQPESRITRREMDLAASIQQVTERIVLQMARSARDRTGCENLCLAGGVALNCVANGKLRDAGIFKEIWIQPASGDAGGALGAALLAHHHLFDGERVARPRDSMRGSYLGPGFDDAAIHAFLESKDLPFRRIDDDRELMDQVAAALAAGKVVGWFQGRMEFGPRSLGARSILGDPRRPEMQSRMNLKIKHRESFRPFAPSVLASHCREVFELDADSPYMLLVAPVRAELRREVPSAAGDDLIEQVNQVRSSLPAITHVDGSARVQTVDERNGPYHDLLLAFHRLTGCPVLINTSFNVRGEPIVCTPDDALRCFQATDIDLLVLGRHLLEKDPTTTLTPDQRQQHLNRFTLD
jgi:carbamoyltransferase